LAAEREEAGGGRLPMSGSLVKALYILHWMLMDAAAECNENVKYHILSNKNPG
jgi:hypothetical protein